MLYGGSIFIPPKEDNLSIMDKICPSVSVNVRTMTYYVYLAEREYRQRISVSW